MKIYAPVKDANGVYASVRFVNGVGETDNPRLIEWFKTHGYKVPIEDSIENQLEEVANPIEKSLENCVDDSGFVDLNKLAEEEPDLDAMTPNELREYARAKGLGNKIKNTRNKEKLLEIIRG